MSDHPINFTAPMIRALLDGRKTMDRRLAWQEGGPKVIKGKPMTGFRRSSPWQRVKPGDRLWVRERYQAKAVGWYFETDTDGTVRHHWRNPMFMPRALSRLTLVVTATKIERVQEITAEDAKAEGIKLLGKLGKKNAYHWDTAFATDLRECHESARSAFRLLWNTIHGVGSWNANPECVCLTFTVHKTNIDALEDAAQ